MVNSIDINYKNYQIKISYGGEIINQHNERIGSTDGEILYDEFNDIVKIKENIVTEDYSICEFYYSSNELIFLKFKKENYKKRKVNTLENCAVYILNNLIFTPKDQTSYCSLNFRNLINRRNQLFKEESNID